MPETAIATETDIMALVERVRQMRQAVEAAWQAREAAVKALAAADAVLNTACLDFEHVQDDLVVAAGGTNRIFTWMMGNPPPPPEDYGGLERKGI